MAAAVVAGAAAAPLRLIRFRFAFSPQNGSVYTFGRDANIMWKHGILQVRVSDGLQLHLRIHCCN